MYCISLTHPSLPLPPLPSLRVLLYYDTASRIDCYPTSTVVERLGEPALGDGVSGHVSRAVAQPVSLPSRVASASCVRLGLPLAHVPDYGETAWKRLLITQSVLLRRTARIDYLTRRPSI